MGQAMSTELDKFLENRSNQKLFEQESLILEVTEAICSLMNEQGVTRTELAKRLCCSLSNVSQILDGENNFTARKVADILFELGARLTVATEPLEKGCEQPDTGWQESVYNLDEPSFLVPQQDHKAYVRAAQFRMVA